MFSPYALVRMHALKGLACRAGVNACLAQLRLHVAFVAHLQLRQTLLTCAFVRYRIKITYNHGGIMREPYRVPQCGKSTSGQLACTVIKELPNSNHFL